MILNSFRKGLNLLIIYVWGRQGPNLAVQRQPMLVDSFKYVWIIPTGNGFSHDMIGYDILGHV